MDDDHDDNGVGGMQMLAWTIISIGTFALGWFLRGAL